MLYFLVAEFFFDVDGYLLSGLIISCRCSFSGVFEFGCAFERCSDSERFVAAFALFITVPCPSFAIVAVFLFHVSCNSVDGCIIPPFFCAGWAIHSKLALRRVPDTFSVSMRRLPVAPFGFVFTARWFVFAIFPYLGFVLVLEILVQMALAICALSA